jgi:hypothetical protein
MRPTLAVHSVLLLLAATNFTVVTFFFGDRPWEFCYYQFGFRNGFGFEYVSNYSLAEVLTYLAAFAVGTVGFYFARQEGRSGIGSTGFVLSVLGMVSFAIEGSHWLLDHHRSYVVFLPVVMFALSLLACLPRRNIVSIENTEDLSTAQSHAGNQQA